MEPEQIGYAAPDGGAAEAANAASAAPIDWSRVAEVDLDEFFRQHPEAQRRFAGQVGIHAQRQAQSLAQQLAQQQIAAERDRITAEATARVHQTELDQLRQTDLYAWDQKAREYEQVTRTQQAEAQAKQAHLLAAAGAYADIDQQILQPLAQGLPPEDVAEIQQQLSQMQAQGYSGYQIRQAWSQGVMQKHAARQVATERQRWDQAKAAEIAAAREAWQKEALGTANGTTRVDSGAGAPTPGVPSLTEWTSYTRAQRVQMTKADPSIEDRIMARAVTDGEGVSFNLLRQGNGVG